MELNIYLPKEKKKSVMTALFMRNLVDYVCRYDEADETLPPLLVEEEMERLLNCDFYPTFGKAVLELLRHYRKSRYFQEFIEEISSGNALTKLIHYARGLELDQRHERFGYYGGSADSAKEDVLFRLFLYLAIVCEVRIHLSDRRATNLIVFELNAVLSMLSGYPDLDVFTKRTFDFAEDLLSL